MLKETENEPKTPTEAVSRNFYSSQSHAIGGRRTATPTSEDRSNSVASIRSDNVAASSVRSQQHVATSTIKSENLTTSFSNACETSSEQQADSNVTEEDTVTICTDCERVIVGVFVRIKDKNLHVECFKCSTCGTSLKNVGYYNINNKLYCDIHAKSAALRSNANPNLVPVTVPPGGKAPAHAISSALSSHSLPTPSALSPKLNNSFASPYQNQELNGNAEQALSPLPNPNSEANNNNLYSSAAPLPFSKYLNKTSNLSGPRPFSSVSAPLSPHNTLPRSTGPISPVAQVPPPSYNTPIHNTPSYSPVSSTGRFSTMKTGGGLFKGAGTGRQAGGVSVAPRRGRGVLNAAALAGARIPLCGSCNMQIRPPEISPLRSAVPRDPRNPEPGRTRRSGCTPPFSPPSTSTRTSLQSNQHHHPSPKYHVALPKHLPSTGLNRVQSQVRLFLLFVLKQQKSSFRRVLHLKRGC
ncbi:unnamed protein product [Acanthoscelides obtectus]|uniref:LIM zinc-binding domain-containing protein n=1 Tax=Acanthoscelides obtectus TaxID=200917 RepID=A0A9P0K6E9_ACAOB|nr:unnamed protein product [Acanthoscelides obtectus]CAK1653210.1 PDZ and LIM domain protein Zasp [Acanthoscelides obtectus]